MRSYKELNTIYQGGYLHIAEMIDSLEGCPQHITGYFDCGGNHVTSLIYGPQQVDGHYNCAYNILTELTGCASHIDGVLNFSGNKITSLIGIHKIIKNCKKILFDCDKITEGGIGLLMIGGMSYISSDTPPFEIIKSYLGTGTKGMMECSKELMSKGHTKYTKL